MRSLSVFSALVVALMFGASQAQASIAISPALGYISTKTDASGSSSEVKETDIGFRGGYIFPMGLYVGAQYFLLSQDSGSSKTKFSSYGPSVGYVSSGFNAILTYHISSDVKNDSTTLYKSGTGPQFDIGYYFSLAPTFGLGPQLSYASIKYTKTGTDAAADYKVTVIRPMIALWFVF